MARLTARERHPKTVLERKIEPDTDHERWTEKASNRESASEEKREMDRKKCWVITCSCIFSDVVLIVFLPSYLYLCTPFSLLLNSRIMYYPSFGMFPSSTLFSLSSPEQHMYLFNETRHSK